ncbi:MAG TPA: LysR family transcriptional regulator [Alphaproteobacteria bacterium]|nr:LysR family transcriptional regulator [Alphaproteobacteria bacterium]
MTPIALENRLEARLKLKQLRLLVQAGEQHNILRAAQLLNMAQPAATKIIRDLELALDVSLFDRSSRGVTPTLYGEVIIKHSKLILAQLRHVSEEIVSIKAGTTGKVTVGTLLAAAPILLPRSIIRLKQERPNVSFSVVEGTNDMLMPMLRVGDLDLVLGRLPEYSEREGLAQEVLYYGLVSIVARKNHPLTKRKSLTLADLVHEDWILPPPQTSLRSQFDAEFLKAGFDPPPRAVESISSLSNHSLLLESDMLGVMPYHVVEALHGLVRLPINLKIGAGPVGITFRDNADLTPAAASFVEVLRKVASEMAEVRGRPDRRL